MVWWGQAGGAGRCGRKGGFVALLFLLAAAAAPQSENQPTNQSTDHPIDMIITNGYTVELNSEQISRYEPHYPKLNSLPIQMGLTKEFETVFTVNGYKQIRVVGLRTNAQGLSSFKNNAIRKY